MPDVRGAVALTTNYALDKAKHGSPELHKFGQSLLDPTFVANVPHSTVAAVGQSEEVARADHIHGLSQATLDAITNAQSTANNALSVANGNTSGASQGASLYNQVNTPVNFASFQPLRFNSVVANMGSGENTFYYIRQGPMVDFFGRWSVANDSSYGLGALQIWIPLALNSVSGDMPCGHARMVDSGGGSHHAMPIATSSGSGYTVFQLINVSMTWYASNGSPGTPMTWTAGDYGRVQGRFYTNS